MAESTSVDAGVADQVTALTAELDAAANQIETQVNEEQSGQESQTGVQTEVADESAANQDDIQDAAKLAETLKAREAELARANRQYAELQAMEARHFNEQREREMQLRERLARLEAVANRQPEPDPDAIMERQRKFDEEWSERLSPGDPDKGRATLELFRGMMTEYLDETRKMVESKMDPLTGRVREMNPVYREHKEMVDSLVEKGLAPDAAMLAVELVNANKTKAKQTVSQPGKVQAPGSVAAPTRTTSTTKPVQPLSISYDPVAHESLRLAGFSPENIDSIMREAAKEHANA